MEKRDYPVIVVGGPSGSGKDTLIAAALYRFAPTLKLGKITVTRPRRSIDADAYRFLTVDEFRKLAVTGKFIEHAQYSDHYYGRQWSDLNRSTCVITQEVWGFEKLAETVSPLVTIFIAPPSLDVLKQRLIARGTETAESLEKRLASAKKELERIPLYEHCVINDYYQDAELQLFNILDSLVG